MSKKLLNETQVRRFMKLANINEGGYGGMGAMGARDEDEGADPVGADPAAAAHCLSPIRKRGSWLRPQSSG